MEFSSKWKKLDIIPLSCFHIGSPYFNEKKLKNWIKWIAEKETRRAWILGDIFDAILAGSPGNQHEQTMSLKNAKLLAERILKPIVKQIDLVIPGNHDGRVFNLTSDEIVFDLCKWLNIEDKYHFGDFTGTIRFGKNHGKRNKLVAYTFYTTHGTGGAATQGGKINKLMQLCNIVENCDLYVMAHVHDILTCKLSPFSVDSRNGQLKEIKQTFVSSSSWLDYGGYALEKKYRPAKTGSPRIRLYGNKKDCHVSI